MADKLSQETEEKIKILQMNEQALQNALMQKQQYQIQLLEIESAIKELEASNEAYKIIGNIMVAAKSDDLKKDLLEKKEMHEIRIRAFEKQEKQIKEKNHKLQEEVMEHMKEQVIFIPSDSDIQHVIHVLTELHEDATIPRNVKIKILKVMRTLDEDNEITIKVNKALDELDDVADDINLQPYTRTQVWNVVSLLEKII